ncbi:MAG: hypothetical protein Q4G69_00785 [Planctomycetia bacterium]|nr:hypothetical protein [Planctomycetia bacterium]
MKSSLYPEIQKIFFTILLFLFVFGTSEFSSAQEVRNTNIISFSIPVGVDKAFLHSGPGENYYSTGELARGENVDIFMRNPDGWCAIRPPKGSFSWINARFIQSVSGEIGLIRSEDSEKEIPVRVGAESVMKSSVIQVGLKGGRKVRILGESTVPGGSRWYKIAPPAGEFRWIHEKMLYQDNTIQRLPSQLTLARKNLATLSKDELQEYPQQNTPSQNQAVRSPVAQKFANQNPAAQNTANQNPGSENSIPQNLAAQSSAPKADYPIIADRVKDLPGRPDTPKSDSSPIGKNLNPDYKIPYQEPQTLADGFYLEVSRLDHDLYNAINQGAAPDVYARLSERCEVLFKAAQDDQQRTAVKNVFDTVEQLKNEKNITTSIPNTANMGNPYQNPNFPANPYSMQTPYNGNNPYNGANAYGGGVPYNGNAVPSMNPPAKKTTQTFSKGSRLKNMQFAFSKDQSPFKRETGNSGRISNTSRDAQNRSIFTQPSGPTLVPPPDYVPLPISVPTTQTPVNAVPLQKSNEAGQEKDPSFLASKKENKFSVNQDIHVGRPDSAEKIRPVNVVLDEKDANPISVIKNPSGKPMDIANWTPPDQYKKKGADPSQIRRTAPNTAFGNKNNAISYGNSNQSIVPVAVQQPSGANNAFDAVGRLGYFPNHPEGYPAYALVDSEMNILCFVEAESGKKLDRFVGKMIGVKGRRGWFQRGSEGKMLITAKSIFTLK